MKKKVFVFALIVTIFLILVYRYNINYKGNINMNQKESESNLVIYESGDVTMTVERVVDTKITVRINYLADDPAIFGEDYVIEVKKGHKWYSLPVNDNIMFTSIGYELKKGNNLPWSTDIEVLYGKLSPGLYRIIKSYRIEPPQEDSKVYFISAEFSI